MSAPRFGENGKKAVLPVGMDSAVPCEGGGALGVHLSRDYATGGTANGEIDLSVFRGFPLNEGKINFLKLSLLHGKGKYVCRMSVSCGKDGAAGFAVKAGDGAENIGAVRVAKSEGVGKGVIVMPVGGMCGHVAAFVAKRDVFVFI